MTTLCCQVFYRFKHSKTVKFIGITGLVQSTGRTMSIKNELGVKSPDPPSDMLQENNKAPNKVNEPSGSSGTLSKRALKKRERIRKWKEQGNVKKTKKKLNVEEPGFGSHLYQETDYYFENGLRKVYPYYFTFSTHVKQRWVGRSILDVFTTEFRAYSELNYRNAIGNGQVTVQGKAVSPDYILKDNELITNTIHRHENPVVGCPVEVLAHTDDVIVVNKPSSIPCHPCGKYRHNSIVFIVGRQLGCANLRNIYRLDRLTSGVLIMGKTTEKTKILEDQVMNRLVKKEYVCRVVGDFPDGMTECKEPIGVISHKLGLFRVRPDGKACHTTFEKISFNGKSSVVKCYPHTGRTHQLRVHLQYLGHPIINDPFYNSEAWGPNKNKGGIMEKSDQEVSDRMLELHNIGHWTDGVNPLYEERLKEIEAQTEKAAQPSPTDPQVEEPAAKKAKTDDAEPASNDDQDKLMTGTLSNEKDESKTIKCGSSIQIDTSPIPPFVREKWIPDRDCESCSLKYVDPTKEELVMFLHALKYTGPDWEYSTPVPDWAQENWQDQQ